MLFHIAAQPGENCIISHIWQNIYYDSVVFTEMPPLWVVWDAKEWKFIPFVLINQIWGGTNTQLGEVQMSQPLWNFPIT